MPTNLFSPCLFPPQDELYTQEFLDAIHDAARRVLGPLPALQYAR